MSRSEHSKEHEEFILDFIGGDTGTARSVRELLDTCPECQRFFEEYSFLLDVVESDAFTDALRALVPAPQALRGLAVLVRTGFRDIAEVFFRKTVALAEPIGLAALSPLEFERASAASGGSFEKDVKSEGSIFNVELSTFGERLTIKLQANSPAYNHAVVRFELLEGESVLFTDVVLVSEGTGKYETDLKAIPTPKKEKLVLNLMPVHTVDIFAGLEKGVTVQVLSQLLKSDVVEVRRSCAKLLAWAKTGPALEALRNLVEDADEEVRKLAQAALAG